MMMDLAEKHSRDCLRLDEFENLEYSHLFDKSLEVRRSLVDYFSPFIEGP